MRHALWPLELSKDKGSIHVARIRRFERQFSLEEIRKLVTEKNPLPVELDLGIDFDLLLPLAYDRFAENNKTGDLLHGVRIEKALDSGGLLVTLHGELKGIIWESELGLDSNGRLRKAASYELGTEVIARIISMSNERKSVRCSMFRILPPPPDLVTGSVIEAVVALVRPAYKDPDRWELSCSLERQFAVRVTAPRIKEIRFHPGDKIKASVLRVNRTYLVEATFLNLIEGE